MTNDPAQFGRSWQEIALQASKEMNPDRLVKLATELDRILDEGTCKVDVDLGIARHP
jgi:hypothetical protein